MATVEVEVVTEEELRTPHGLGRALRDALPLLVGMGLLMAGTGLTATLLGVRAGLEGFNTTVTGFIMSAFYAGFLAGSLVTPRTIWRVGHVRVFAGLASLASASVLVHVVLPEPVTWFLLRALSGVCLAGLYVVTETWLNGAATNSTRGGLLGVYMVVVTGSQGLGQLLFPVADPRGYAAFVLASVLVSVAVVPVSLATVSPPSVLDVQPLPLREVYRTAPLAIVGAGVAGFSGAAIVGGGGAVYAGAADLTRGQTSALLFAALAGALVLQIPFGRWSDRTDRRRVVVFVAAMGALAAGLAVVVGGEGVAADGRFALLVLLALFVGGTSFLVYSLANAHLNDWLEEDRMVVAGAAMVRVFAVGAIAGPVAVSAGIDLAGPEALFILLAGSYGVVGTYAVWRMTRQHAVPEEERSTYAALPVGTAPTVAALSDAPPEAFYPEPAAEETATTDRGEFLYRTQGNGWPVVLLGEPGEVLLGESGEESAWEPLLGAFAANGVYAIGVDLRPPAGPGDTPVEDLLAVLRDLELPSATFVGMNGGAVELARLVDEHPDRVDAVVYASPAMPMPEDSTVPVAHPEQTEVAGRALLVLTEDLAVPYWDEPTLFADVVVDFIRRALAEHSGDWRE